MNHLAFFRDVFYGMLEETFNLTFNFQQTF